MESTMMIKEKIKDRPKLKQIYISFDHWHKLQKLKIAKGHTLQKIVHDLIDKEVKDVTAAKADR